MRTEAVKPERVRCAASFGLSVSYDAENHPTVAWEPPSMGGGSVSYWYDGLGERTVWALPTQEFVYAFDAFGQLAVKYAQGTTPVQEYIWFGSQLLATENSNNGAPCSTCYFVWDHLGSTRLVLDQYANVIARHDYLPFGEEIPGGWAGRDSSFGVNDSLDQKFTGQQRDGESGEDNFNARYFAGSMGRFMSPDPMNAGAVLTDPQTWNGYVYVRNNPMSRIDPSGMDDGGCSPENDPFCYPDWPPFFPPLPTPDPPPPVTVKEPVPPGSFPGGETLGLPPGTSIPGPFSAQVLLGLYGWDCGSGICVPGFGSESFSEGASEANCNTGPLNLSANITFSRQVSSRFWSGVADTIQGNVIGINSVAVSAGSYVGLVHTGGAWDPKTTLGATPTNVAAGT